MPRQALTYRRVAADVSEAMAALLRETGRMDDVPVNQSLIPGLSSPNGWREKSAPSWAGFLKRVEARLRVTRPEYRLLRVTATDGHRTWRLPVAITTHLLTEKILSANHGRNSARGAG